MRRRRPCPAGYLVYTAFYLGQGGLGGNSGGGQGGAGRVQQPGRGGGSQPKDGLGGGQSGQGAQGGSQPEGGHCGAFCEQGAITPVAMGVPPPRSKQSAFMASTILRPSTSSGRKPDV